MGKALLFIAVFFTVLLCMRFWSVHKKKGQDNKPKSPPEKQHHTEQALVKCTSCNKYIPKAESVLAAQGYRCQHQCK
jgi:hypothetical protein